MSDHRRNLRSDSVHIRCVRYRGLALSSWGSRVSPCHKGPAHMNDNRNERLRVMPTFALLMLVPVLVWVFGWV
jgi:hypothetical protein